MPTIRIAVYEATTLLAADFDGKSDPYCVIKLGSSAGVYSSISKTRIINKTLNPTWNEVFTMNINNPNTEILMIEVFDHDNIGKDDNLGSASLPLNDLQRGVEKRVWLSLTGGTKGSNVIGSIISNLGKKKGAPINNYGKVHIGITALDFGLYAAPSYQSAAPSYQTIPSMPVGGVAYTPTPPYPLPTYQSTPAMLNQPQYNNQPPSLANFHPSSTPTFPSYSTNMPSYPPPPIMNNNTSYTSTPLYPPPNNNFPPPSNYASSSSINNNNFGSQYSSALYPTTNPQSSFNDYSSQQSLYPSQSNYPNNNIYPQQMPTYIPPATNNQPVGTQMGIMGMNNSSAPVGTQSNLHLK